jgi:hypothetical protein
VAKKVRKDGEKKEEKKVVFEPPEFDEKQYIIEEMEKSKVTMFYMMLAIPFGAFGAYLGVVTGSGWPGFLVATAGIFVGWFFLRNLMGIDILQMEKKRLAVPIAMFFFAWLAFAIVFSNPPFYDQGDPSIADIRVYVQNQTEPNETWQLFMLKGEDKDEPNASLVMSKEAKEGNLVARAGDKILVLVRAADPSGIDSVRIEFWYTSRDDNYTLMTSVSEEKWSELEPDGIFTILGEHYYEHPALDADLPGNLYFKVIVEDANGQVRTFTTKFVDSVTILPSA